MDVDRLLVQKVSALLPYLNERQRRLFLAAEARSLGAGGSARVARAARVSRPTIQVGLRELAGPLTAPERVRRPGGGRKPLRTHDPARLPAVEALVDPDTRGDPMSPLRWTCKRTRQLAIALTDAGHRVRPTVVAALLDQAGDSRQALAKTREGRPHPDRAAQFRSLNEQVKAFMAAGQPLVAVDAKPRRRSGGAPARTAGGKGSHRDSPRRSPCMMSPTRSWARRSRPAATTWDGTPAG